MLGIVPNNDRSDIQMDNFDHPTDGPRLSPTGGEATPRTATKTTRYLLTAALVTGAVTVGAFLSPIGLAGAESGDNGDATTSESGDADSSGGDGAEANMLGHHRHGEHGRGHGHGPVGEAVAGIIGITVDELRAGFAEGKSLAEIAADNGVDADTLTAGILAELESHLDEAVADGRIDQETADQRLAEATERLDDLINRTPGEGPLGERLRGRFGHHGPRAHGLIEGAQELADDLGLSLDDIRASLADGQTLAEAAEAQGVSEDELVEALVEAAEARLDEAVENGRLDPDRAVEIAESLEERITDLVNRTPGEGFGDGIHSHPHVHLHSHPHGHGDGPGIGGRFGLRFGPDGEDTDTDTGELQESSFTA